MNGGVPGARLEREDRTVTWTEKRRVVVGYSNCGVCNVETPAPTQDRLIAFAKENYDGATMWPDPEDENSMPPGWTDDQDEGLLCPECTATKRDAFDARRNARTK